MNLQEIGDGLARALEQIPDMNVYRRGINSYPKLPAVAIYPPDEIDFNAAYAEGVHVATFELLVLISQLTRDAQDLHEELLSTEGDRSLYRALVADRRLGGACSNLVPVGGVTRVYQFRDDQRLIAGVDFTVAVYVGRTR